MKISSEKRCDSYNFLDKSTAVQIPVDACPTFVLKRRSFSFVIDKKQPQPRLFLYTGKSVRLNKNAHCFAVEPSGYPQRAAGTSLLRARFFCLFVKEKPSEIRTVFCCLDLLFFVEKCLVDIIVFC